MFGLFATTAAVMAGSALAANVGSAVVVNQCSYPVHLCNTPATGGGYSEVDRLLQTGDSYTQPWTQLSNTMGWSIKLSKTSAFGDNIMQYEYTYHGDDIIWYDLSEVNGNPWNGDFEITAQSQSSCTPRQVAYRFATDDAYGMQDCPADSTITVTLCSGDDNASSSTGGSGSGSGSGSDSGSAESTPSTPASAAPTTVAPTTSTSTPQPAYTAPVAAAVKNPEAAPSQEVAPLSNLAVSLVAPTSQTDSTKAPAQTSTTTPAETPAQQYTPTTLETVTRTEWVTIDTTETAWAHGKRHAHAYHPHHPRH